MPHQRLTPVDTLYARFRCGDDAALAALIAFLQPRLQAHARRLGARPHEVEELLQDLWLALSDRQAPGPSGPLVTWLNTLLHHRLVDMRRAQRHRSRLRLVDGPEPEPASGVHDDAFAVARGREVLAAVRSAIAAEPAVFREVLYLHLFEGLAPAEIAGHLGISGVAVRVRLFRGLRRLRRALPQGLSLLLLATLARQGRSQTATWILAAATVTALATTSWWIGGQAADALPELATPSVTVTASNAALAPPADESPPVTARSAVHALAPELVIRCQDEHGAPLPAVGVALRPGPGMDGALMVRRGHTDDRGEVRLPQPPPGHWHVTTDRGHDVELSDNPTGPVVLRAQGGVDVTGRVVDDAGRPLPAEVWLSATPGDELEGDIVTTTDATGAFHLRNVRPGSCLSAWSPAHARARAVPARTNGPTTLVLPRGGGAIDGVVVDDTGAALADAVVVIGLGPEGISARVAGGWLAETPPPRQFRSDADGAFHVEGMEAGEHPIVVRSRGRAPTLTWANVRAGETTRAVVRLTEGVTLQGRVVDERGAPLGDVRVSCRNDDPFTAADIDTDADGRFEFAALPCGSLALSARGRNSIAIEQVLEHGPGAHATTLVARQLVAHHGVVTTLDGRGLAGWELALPLPNARRIDPAAHAGVAEADGTAVLFTNAEPCWDDLLVRPPGCALWIPAGDLVSVLHDGRFVVTVDPDSQPRSRLHLHLRDEHGLPLANAPVFARLRLGDDVPIGRADDNGELDFGPLFADRYRLLVASPGPSQPPLLPETIDIASDSATELVLASPPTGRLAFRLFFADGGAPRAPAIVVRPRGEQTRLASARAADGTQTLPPGEYDLTALGDDFVWVGATPFTIAAGDTTTLEIPVRRAARQTVSLRNLPAPCFGGRLRGRFLDRRDGSLLARFEVPLDQAGTLPLSTFLPLGDVRLVVTAANGLSYRADFSVAELHPVHQARSLEFAPLAPSETAPDFR